MKKTKKTNRCLNIQIRSWVKNYFDALLMHLDSIDTRWPSYLYQMLSNNVFTTPGKKLFLFVKNPTFLGDRLNLKQMILFCLCVHRERKTKRRTKNGWRRSDHRARRKSCWRDGNSRSRWRDTTSAHGTSVKRLSKSKFSCLFYILVLRFSSPAHEPIYQ